MEDEEGNITGQSNSQSLPNNTTTRSVERTATQKLPIPILEKNDHTSAKLWWRKFVQYIKMTREIDLSKMTNSKEILPQFREQLEEEIKDVFIWAIGQSAITEMTKTVREREPNSLPLYRLYTLFRLHFIPERNKHHSRADFFNLKREPGESAAETWKRILEIEKNCEFEEITAAELLASKFLSVIGKTTGDNDLKKKIKKGDMSVEAITDTIHEYMYEKMNESRDSEEETKIKHVDRKRTYQKPEKERQNKFRKVDCIRCGAPNWSKSHDCPARTKKCLNCGKIGHFARLCRSKQNSDRRIKHIQQDSEATSAEEDNWTPNKIHSINKTIHSTIQISKHGQPFFTATVLVNNRPIKFIIDSGSPVTIIPKQKFNGITTIYPLNEEYRDVNNNKIKFEGKTMANIEIDGEKKKLELLITTKRTNPLLGLDWMKHLGINVNVEKSNLKIQNIQKDPDIIDLKNKFKKLFHENKTVKGIEVDIQLKPDAKLIQQKGRPIPIHLQPAVGKEIEKLMKNGHIEKATDIDKNCFVSPAVITVKRDKSVKIALDSRKLNEITVKRKAQMPNMEELISRISRKIADGEADEIWISKFDLDYAYGQLPLSKNAMDLCIFAVTGGNFTGYYRFLKGLYGLADIPTIFQEKIDQTLENKHPAWLDDILVVTKGTKEQHKRELIDVLTKLENAGYRLSENKTEFFKSEIEWVGHKIDQNGIRPLQDKLKAIQELKEPKNEKELKSFLGAIQYLSKYIENLSAQTDLLRQLLKKNNEWSWTPEHSEAFTQLKNKITEIPCLAHYSSNLPNTITTDASTKGLGATLWQEQHNGELKPIAFASRFLSDTEKKYAINELELLAVVWGLEHFRLYIYGKPIKLLTDHQALEPLIKRNRSNKTYSARLTRWLDRLAHFSINVNHIAGKHLALTDYLSRNPIAPPQQDEAYEEEYVINSIVPHYEFVSKVGCLSNHLVQSQARSEMSKGTKANKQPSTERTREQNAINSIDRIKTSSKTHQNQIDLKAMDARTVDNLERIDNSKETTDLIERWRNIVKPGIYRLSNGKWKKYHEPKFLRGERREIEERLSEIIRKLESPAREIRNRPQQSDEYSADWQSTAPAPQNFRGGFIQRTNNDQPGTSRAEPVTQQDIIMEEGEISSDSELAPSVLEVPTINWANYIGVKSVQYIKMGHAPRVQALEQNSWDLEQTVRETEKEFATDLQLLMTETTNDPKLLKTLVCLERQQYDNIPDEYTPYKKKLSTRYGLVFYEDKIIVPINLRTTVISLLHKGHPAINKMTLSAKHFWWPKLMEAIQRKCDSCIPCKLSGKNIKPNIPRTEQNSLPPLNAPNEEIQLDFIGPITDQNRRFYILLSMDRFSKWPAASLCKTTDGETATKFLEQYCNLNGVPKTIRTDKATAFTGRHFREFCRNKFIKLIYGTPYIHTPTGLVERGVRTLKENLLTNIKAGEPFGKALDLALNVMRTTPHTRLRKSAFELHFGREPNTEWGNMLKLDKTKLITNNSISARPDTLQVYTFSGEGGSSDHLPMKQKRKGAKTVSKYPFQFFERKNQKGKFESPYSEHLQTAVTGTEHTVTTSDNKIIHRKLISKPINTFEQEPTNRGTGPRGPDGRFSRKQDKTKQSPEKSPLEEDLDTSPEPPTTKRASTIGRGRPRTNKPLTPDSTPGQQNNAGTGTLTINTDQMSESDIDQTIRDSTQSGQEIQIKDNSGKVTIYNNKIENKLDLSELELASNLSSSTELEEEIEQPKNTNLRRSKRLTNTNPIVRLNNPVNQSDYRKHNKTTQPTTTGILRGNAGAKRRGRPVNRPEAQHASHGTPEKILPDHGRTTGHNNRMDSNGQAHPLEDSPPIKEGGMK